MAGLKERFPPMETPDSSRRVRDQLEVWHDDATTPVVHPLYTDRTVVGRSDRAHIILDDANIAPLHAELVRSSFGRYRVRDLSGSGGLYVGGTPVVDRLLDGGEEVRIGPFRLRVRERSSAEYRFVLPESSSGHSLSRSRGSSEYAIGGEHLASVMKLGRTLTKTSGTRARMQRVCDCLVSPPCHAHSATVLRILEGMQVEVLRGATATGQPDDLEIPARLIEELLTTRGPVMDGRNGTTFMACPLVLDEERVDALFVAFPPTHATNEWLSLVALTAEAHQQSELVWEMRTHVRESARVERELEMAREIQEGLIPRALQFDGLLRGVDIALGFEPCRWVGGDYVDAVALQDGRVLLAVADVCGKGMQAAIVASAVHTAIHVIAGYTTSIQELLERINLHLCNFLPAHSFVTIVCAALDLTSGTLEYASAGHLPAMIVQPGGTVDFLHHGDNPPLGMMDTPIVARTTALGVGETLVLYTDGLTELMNEQREALGMVQLAEILSDWLARDPQASARETQSHLVAALRAYRGDLPPSDDTTFLVARRRGASILPPG